ncbi:hypothetical protein M758_8G169200 [Ceratodon purpureus]|nr:hypothetical protein M758_8G169200 [Ceratodon purpureus]
MASVVTKRKTRSQGPPTPEEKPKPKPVVEDDGPIPEVIVAGDDSDSDPEISTDGEESGEDGMSEEDGEGEAGSGSEDEADGDDDDFDGSEYGSGEEGDESSGDEEEVDEDARNYVLDVMKDFLTGAVGTNGEGGKEEEANGNGVGEPEGEAEGEAVNPTAAEESDSSEDEVPDRNTIGDVPLEWYKNEDHIGYTKDGLKIKKQARRDQLDTFLARTEDANEWRKVYDEYNDEEVELTKEEIDMIRRLRQGKIPHAEVNPYEPYVDWFEYEDKGHPLSSAPEPKRRFIPSKWEAKKVVKLVRAIRKGWIKLDKPKEKPEFYLMWGDDLKTSDKTANGLAYIAAPKTKLPGHEESYNPPVEYIPTPEEVKSYESMYEEDRPKFIPTRFPSLRQVPAYPRYINEIFERCLDLYLCPRQKKDRKQFDPETLIPKLPKPKDLQPYPSTCYMEYRGHNAAVTSMSTDSTGEWLATGSMDGTVRLWDVQSGRCRKVWDFGLKINNVQWNPNPQINMLGVAVDKDVVLLSTELGGEEVIANVSSLLTLKEAGAEESPLATWGLDEKFKSLRVRQPFVVQSFVWHHKGDYFATVAPDGITKSVLVHQLSKQQSQNPFRKHHGRVVRVLFHPQRPFLFVATKMHVRIYNLAKQQLSKKLMTSLNEISSMAIHPGGDNLILGSQESKMVWFDMDLSTKPYKAFKNHTKDIRAVAFHKTYPLFASCSDDGTTSVFHGMVYSDLLQNPLLVPLKILLGHKTVNHKGVMDCLFHPRQPWLFTSGADSIVKLYCN